MEGWGEKEKSVEEMVERERGRGRWGDKEGDKK